MTTKACLRIDIWTEGRRCLPSDTGDLAERFSPHLEHVKTLCQQGYVAGEIVDDIFRGWWKIETE